MKKNGMVSEIISSCRNISARFHPMFMKIRAYISDHPYPSAVTTAVVLLMVVLISLPQEGEILPTDPNVVDAYSLLSKSETGKRLIKRVKRSTAGSFIYLSLGTTESDRLTDFYGDTVRGVTRATYEVTGRMVLPKRVAVITNRDLVGTAPRDIVRSLAFELENVDFSFRNPQLDFPSDSPVARQTQERIMEELDL